MNVKGRPALDVLGELAARQAEEPDVGSARLFGLVYPSGREDLEALLTEVSRRYLFGNALNPFRFPRLAEMEAEVVRSVASLLNRPPGETAGGVMTSGGTESILMAMLVARERARARGVERPVIVAPRSAHPAYAKAAHYFGMDLVQVPLDEHWRADTAAAETLIDEQTAVVVASAFCYPYGVMDPVEELAALALRAGAGCHVDACIGGFVLPFLERLRHEVPAWDFRVPGVTSISADVHKYGYVPKGASVVVHRDDDWFAHQAFIYDGWGAGLYGSGAIAGARPAAPVACAWAALNYLGVEGYTTLIAELADLTERFRTLVEGLAGIDVLGEPIGPVLALRSEEVDLYAVATAMDGRGWHLNRLTEPRGLHLMLSPGHAAVFPEVARDLADAVANHGDAVEREVRYSGA